MKLLNIFQNELTNRCDKWSNYFEVYESHLNKFVNRSPTLVEVGVAGGGSLEMWLKYFGEGSQIYGIDIQPQVEKVDGVNLIIGDQNNKEFWNAFLKQIVTDIDIFIDDGSHVNSHQILTFMEVWPKIKDGGVYICEDTHTSYWSEYDGGLNRNGTFIEFSKKLIDGLHSDYLNNIHPSEEFKEMIGSIKNISFYDSQVVFTKGKKINQRIIVNE